MAGCAVKKRVGRCAVSPFLCAAQVQMSELDLRAIPAPANTRFPASAIDPDTVAINSWGAI